MTAPPKPCKRWGGRHRKSDGRPLIGKRYAYRELWIEEHGSLGNRVLHHKCHNKWCVELEHLEPQSRYQHLKEHALDSGRQQRERTHCPQGHPYSERNTAWVTRRGPGREGKRERHCRTCMNDWKRKSRAKKHGMPY